MQRTFSTLTLFSRTFSTMTLESFHDDSWYSRPFALILFHANDRPHRRRPLQRACITREGWNQPLLPFSLCQPILLQRLSERQRTRKERP